MAIPIVSFTAGGIDVESIVQGLMQVERQPINLLQSRQAKAQLQNDALARLRSSLDSLKSMAGSVITNGVGKLSSSVSSPSAVSASLSPSARAGSVTFTVDQLARAHGLRSATTVASSSSVITIGRDVRAVHQCGRARHLVGAGRCGRHARQLHRVGAAGDRRRNPHRNVAARRIHRDRRQQQHAQPRDRRRGDSPSPSPSGTYDAAGLLGAVQTALVAAGGGATAALDATGRLRLTIDPRGLRRHARRSWAATRQRALGLARRSAPRRAPTDRSRSVPSPPSP